MNLYIDKLVVLINGVITESLSLSRQLSVVVDSPHTHAALQAITGKREGQPLPYTLQFYALVETDAAYTIRGKKEAGASCWQIEVYLTDGQQECSQQYFDDIHAHAEMDALAFNKEYAVQDYPHRLMRYGEALTQHPDGAFAAATEGYGTTRSFRGFLRQYIRYFNPIPMRGEQPRWMTLLSDGTFGVVCRGKRCDHTLKESDRVLFHYLAFLNVADFWARAEKVRNLHRLNRPLWVSGLVEGLSHPSDLIHALRLTHRLRRQTLLFVQNKETQEWVETLIKCHIKGE